MVWILEARGAGQERDVRRVAMRVVGSWSDLRYLVPMCVSEGLGEYEYWSGGGVLTER